MNESTRRHSDDDSHFPLNHPLNLIERYRRFETCEAFFNEGLIKTYPTSVLKKQFQDFLEETLDKETLDLTEFQLMNRGSTSEKFCQQVEENDFEDNGVVAGRVLFRFAFPKAQKDRVAKELDSFVKSIVVTGYFLVSITTEDPLEQPISSTDLEIAYVAFEAKYTQSQFEFSDNLYHLSEKRLLEKISRQGLRPHPQSKEFKYPERVYLFNNIELKTILWYAVIDGEERFQDEFALLRIDSKKLQEHRLYKSGKLMIYVDPKISNADSHLPQAIYTYESIPRELLEDDVALFSVDEDGNPRKDCIIKLS